MRFPRFFDISKNKKKKKKGSCTSIRRLSSFSNSSAVVHPACNGEDRLGRTRNKIIQLLGAISKDDRVQIDNLLRKKPFLEDDSESILSSDDAGGCLSCEEEEEADDITFPQPNNNGGFVVQEAGPQPHALPKNVPITSQLPYPPEHLLHRMVKTGSGVVSVATAATAAYALQALALTQQQTESVRLITASQNPGIKSADHPDDQKRKPVKVLDNVFPLPMPSCDKNIHRRRPASLESAQIIAHPLPHPPLLNHQGQEHVLDRHSFDSANKLINQTASRIRASLKSSPKQSNTKVKSNISKWSTALPQPVARHEPSSSSQRVPPLTQLASRVSSSPSKPSFGHQAPLVPELMPESPSRSLVMKFPGPSNKQLPHRPPPLQIPKNSPPESPDGGPPLFSLPPLNLSPQPPRSPVRPTTSVIPNLSHLSLARPSTSMAPNSQPQSPAHHSRSMMPSLSPRSPARRSTSAIPNSPPFSPVQPSKPVIANSPPFSPLQPSKPVIANSPPRSPLPPLTSMTRNSPPRSPTRPSTYMYPSTPPWSPARHTTTMYPNSPPRSPAWPSSSMYPTSPPRSPRPLSPFRWKKGNKLGQGTFGAVYECWNLDEGCFFAVKVSSKDETSPEIQQEVDVLSKLDHPNIVRYLGSSIDEDGHLCIFLELVKMGSLDGILKKYRRCEGHLDNTIRTYTRQILQGLDYLHGKNIIHRDIKCSNILVDVNGNVKLSDFGISKEVDGLLSSVKGTPLYMAPEVLSANGKKNSYSFPADIWSLGCTVYEMATGKPPWSDLPGFAFLFKVKNGEVPPMPTHLSQDAKDFILKCLKLNPCERPTASQLLRHSFVANLPIPE